MTKKTPARQTNVYPEKRSLQKAHARTSNLVLGQISSHYNTQLRTRFLKYLANQS
jgi:hypothetical protein